MLLNNKKLSGTFFAHFLSSDFVRIYGEKEIFFSNPYGKYKFQTIEFEPRTYDKRIQFFKLKDHPNFTFFAQPVYSTKQYIVVKYVNTSLSIRNYRQHEEQIILSDYKNIKYQNEVYIKITKEEIENYLSLKLNPNEKLEYAYVFHFADFSDHPFWSNNSKEKEIKPIFSAMVRLKENNHYRIVNENKIDALNLRNSLKRYPHIIEF